MLTRLKVSGFKNLVEVDVRLGPFTCVAGANGVGKSNLFDAIKFLSAIASHGLIEAALSVRDEGGRTADVRSLFHRVGDDYANEMSFEAEMIVPLEGVDDLGQNAKASITFLRYSITNTHSPAVVSQVPDDSLLVAELKETVRSGQRFKRVCFSSLPETWREKVSPEVNVVSRGKLLVYLNEVILETSAITSQSPRK